MRPLSFITTEQDLKCFSGKGKEEDKRKVSLKNRVVEDQIQHCLLGVFQFPPCGKYLLCHFIKENVLRIDTKQCLVVINQSIYGLCNMERLYVNR